MYAPTLATSRYLEMDLERPETKATKLSIAVVLYKIIVLNNTISSQIR